jgi:hypothetical protein
LPSRGFSATAQGRQRGLAEKKSSLNPNVDSTHRQGYVQNMTFLLNIGFVLVFVLLGTAIWGSFKKSPTEQRQQRHRPNPSRMKAKR